MRRREFINLHSAVLAMAALLAAFPAQAQTVRIVALGASNTAGTGVGAGSAWPAQLETMLRAKGHRVQIINAGSAGDDTGRMLARLGQAVSDGTKVVILDKPEINDRARGVNTAANVAAMTSRLRAQKIDAIVIESMHGWAGRRLQPDGRHITAEGHTAVAARLLPKVVAVIGRTAGR
jgi:acyl-CoA thioesterase-1